MNDRLAQPPVSLDDKYQMRDGWIYLSGTQALVRLPIQQRLRDAAAGHDTGGYISGYRGSPLGRYDMELWRVGTLLKSHSIHFRAAVNEDLAAAALWGSQYVGSFAGAKVAGVFGIWYGKGPGVDRSGDVFRHANSAGTSPLGGVLVLAGDDHCAKSSTIANFSDQILIATGMPVLYPSNTQELLDFGLHGIAMSRFSGCWVGMKVVTDVVEGGGSIYVGLDAPSIAMPEFVPSPALGPNGWHIRAVDMPLPQEDRLYNHKLYAALAYIRANQLNHISHNPSRARVGILAAGKSYQDVLQALAELRLDDKHLDDLGIRVGKIGVIWPLEPNFVSDFAEGLDVVLVVEEKRPLIEEQLKSLLYDLPLAKKPRVVGKFAGVSVWSPKRGAPVLSGTAELSPTVIARVIKSLLRELDPSCCLGRAESVDSQPLPPAPIRSPSFCSGCPHNLSTKIPHGSRALAGIGCHSIALLKDPLLTTTFSHMGGEGAMWLGQQPFTDEAHVFANMGDGTYFHSGFLAIRQAVAAKVPITYKLLVNGFVAMTGGQPIDGELSIPQIVSQLKAEGVQKIAVVTDDPMKYQGGALPKAVPVHPRTDLEAVQRRFREFPDVSVIIYDQASATERRRLRKRGKVPDPDKRTFINAAVCEGCGDCGEASGCLSIEPLETPFGRKRKINQSTCNKDFSCAEGFCPSFVTVSGGVLKRPQRPASGVSDGFASLPEPLTAALDSVYNILITGIGGTGVVTLGQILGMAAHIDGLRASVLDVTGLAQKYGAVSSHIRIARDANALHATRLAVGEADAVIGCDLIVSAGEESLSRMRRNRTRAVLCTDTVPTGEFAHNPDWSVDVDVLTARLRAACGESLFPIEGIRLATALLGDAIAANMLMLGAAWQRGMLPLSLPAIDRAIELNDVQVDFNKRCFLWGRRSVHDIGAVEKLAYPATDIASAPPMAEPLNKTIARRVSYLTDYQSAAYARRYKALVDEVATAETAQGLGYRLTHAAARYYFKLLADKDEWEVARLFASAEFRRQLEMTFNGSYSLSFHIGGWPFARSNPARGRPVKREVGPWLMHAFRLLARARRMRGSWLDPFRHTAERRMSRRLVAEYEQELRGLIATLNPATHELAVRLASLPERIRGYGYVRAASLARVEEERFALTQAMRQVHNDNRS
jgi:indolepyruvate ferredoxin oxidoreductase